MKSEDRRLGMNRPISRRDFLNGTAIAIGGLMMPSCSEGMETKVSSAAQTYYPPLEQGMRGSHPGSFEAAHSILEGRTWETETTGEHYDLVVVGGGISGLSAAYLYRRDINPDANVLVLDNHDDFGGHAKRNEFEIDGKTLIGFGGTMLMEAPRTYPAVAKQVIRELGIDPSRGDEVNDRSLISKYGLKNGVFFDSETFGEDRLAMRSSGFATMLNESPLSDLAKQELERLFADETDYLDGKTPEERREILETTSWRDYLKVFGGFGEEALAFMQKYTHGVWAAGADIFPAFYAWVEEYPGFAGMDLGIEDYDWSSKGGGEDWKDLHFPDGNATIARSLVRKLIPDVAPGTTMDDIVTAPFDYGQLDRESHEVRLRLSSTVIDLRHTKGGLGDPVDVTYVKDDVAHTVTGKRVIWAGYHAMLPHICPDMPEEQAQAMSQSVKAPLTYTTVLLRNWKSLAKLGIQRAFCPGGFFQSIRMVWPTKIGEYQFTDTPDDPVLLHLQHMPLSPGLPAADQFRAGRHWLMEASFETFERNVRQQLQRILGPGGFDAARDIAGITVNRWPHGYAYSMDEASGDIAWWPEYWRHANRPWEIARSKIGSIAIAGTDAASNAMTEAAIEEAHRAVQSFKM